MQTFLGHRMRGPHAGQSPVLTGPGLTLTRNQVPLVYERLLPLALHLPRHGRGRVPSTSADATASFLSLFWVPALGFLAPTTPRCYNVPGVFRDASPEPLQPLVPFSSVARSFSDKRSFRESPVESGQSPVVGPAGPIAALAPQLATPNAPPLPAPPPTLESI